MIHARLSKYLPPPFFSDLGTISTIQPYYEQLISLGTQFIDIVYHSYLRKIFKELSKEFLIHSLPVLYKELIFLTVLYHNCQYNTRTGSIIFNKILHLKHKNKEQNKKYENIFFAVVSATRFFYKQRLFSTQLQCCLIVS